MFNAAVNAYTLPLRVTGPGRMKFPFIAITVLAFALAACGSLSITGTPETATSLNGFRASHGLSQLCTDGALGALAAEHSADMARCERLAGLECCCAPG